MIQPKKKNKMKKIQKKKIIKMKKKDGIIIMLMKKKNSKFVQKMIPILSQSLLMVAVLKQFVPIRFVYPLIKHNVIVVILSIKIWK